jgi:hypothetical protein
MTSQGDESASLTNIVQRPVINFHNGNEKEVDQAQKEERHLD